MSRRTLASILASVMLVLLFVAAAFLPVPYVLFSPGDTVDVLAETRGEEIVQVEGHRRYETDGMLRMTTVAVTPVSRNISLAEALVAWFDGSSALYPRDVVYGPDQSADDVQTENSVQMVSSQDTAIAVALTELGYDLDPTTEILAVTKGAPARGVLKARDQVVSVDGRSVSDPESVSKAVQATKPGDEVEVVVRRGGDRKTLSVPTKASEEDPDQAVIGVVVGQGYDFPFDVSVNISDKIGGPSAGLIFSLAVYDTLTPGSLTDGLDVAGTGTISPEGTVGPIGGIQQKIAGASASGAELFLVPPANCEAAVGADYDESQMVLVKARTMKSAVKSIEAYAADRDADIPRCE
jgi:PDZ domain-containing protein